MNDVFDKLDTGSVGDVFDSLETQPSRDGNNIAGTAVGSLASAGVVYGATKASQGIKGAYNRFRGIPERNSLVNEALNIQKNLGLAGSRIYDTPQLIQSKISEQKGLGQFEQKKLQTKFSVAQKKIDSLVKTFDNEVLNKSSDDLATAIQRGHQGWRNSAYQAWEDGINSITDSLSERGINLDAKKFNEDVIQKTRSQVLSGGTPESSLSSLKELDGDNIDIKKMRGFISSGMKRLPKDAQHKISENFLNYLEENAPGDVKNSLQTLNENYKNFKQIDDSIQKYYNPKTGEYDLGKLRGALSDYAKGKQATITKELLSGLQEAGIINKPMEGIDEPLARVGEVAKKRGGLIALKNKTAISQQLQRENINNQIKQKVDELSMWKNKAQELSSRIKVAQKKVDSRSLAQKVRAIPVVGEAGRIVPQGLNILSMAPQILQALQAIKQNPNNQMGQFYQMATGENPEESFNRWRESQTI